MLLFSNWSFRAAGSLFLTQSSRLRADCFCSQTISSISSGFPPVSHTPVPFERIAPVLQHSSPFRAVCSCFLNTLVPFQRFAPFCACLSNTLVPFERLAPLLKHSSFFRAVCSNTLVSLQSLSRGLLLYSNTLVPFERLPFRAVCPYSQTLWSLSSGLPLLVPFERFAPVVKHSSPFRAVCSCFSHTLVPFERFAPCFSNSPFRTVCSCSQTL